MNNPFNFHFWRMQSHGDKPYLGTNDGSYAFRAVPILNLFVEFQFGFDIFSTSDGVFWELVTQDGFKSPWDFGLRMFCVDSARSLRRDRKSRCILDVAAVLMHGLDLPIPSAFEGQFPNAAYATEDLDAHPLRSSSDAAVAATLAESVLLDAEAETEILQRLQALGYVD